MNPREARRDHQLRDFPSWLPNGDRMADGFAMQFRLANGRPLARRGDQAHRGQAGCCRQGGPSTAFLHGTSTVFGPPRRSVVGPRSAHPRIGPSGLRRENLQKLASSGQSVGQSVIRWFSRRSVRAPHRHPLWWHGRCDPNVRADHRWCKA